MDYRNKPYTLRMEIMEKTEHYFLSFHDGQGNFQEEEIGADIYRTFLEFEREDRREQNFYSRYIEHSELTDETLNKRALHLPKSIEEYVCDREHSDMFWMAVGELPQKQRRRFLLYYDFGFTYERIAVMEGCTKMPVKRSIEKAVKKIKEKIKKI